MDKKNRPLLSQYLRKDNVDFACISVCKTWERALLRAKRINRFGKRKQVLGLDMLWLSGIVWNFHTGHKTRGHQAAKVAGSCRPRSCLSPLKQQASWVYVGSSSNDTEEPSCCNADKAMPHILWQGCPLNDRNDGIWVWRRHPTHCILFQITAPKIDMIVLLS